MKTIKTPIIPIQQTFAKLNQSHDLDLKAICVFAATGFFLDQDTYWKDEVVLPPASINTIDDKGYLIKTEPWFKWFHAPRELTFNKTVGEFTELFETIVQEQIQGKRVILPLSGGLDSRTQAAALNRLKAEVLSYSYEFQNGYKETQIAQQIAETCGFEFEKYNIPKGYLWNKIDKLTEINSCYSDFCTPRQMAIYNEFDTMGDVFSLGHWGDVLFNDMGVEDDLSFERQVDVVLSKIIKKGGKQLAETLWKTWSLEGDFYDYFHSRVAILMKNIDIPHSANARIRAFKSMYWAPRWTSVNLAIFQSKHPVCLPYYHDSMCQFICELPEQYLAKRQIQIEYIKQKAPHLAEITWQDHRPFSINSYHLNKLPYNLPYRIKNKLGRTLNVLHGKRYVQRNWELQLIGEENKSNLKGRLLKGEFNDWVPTKMVKHYLNNLESNPTSASAHPVNVLLTLSQFHKQSDCVTTN
ncbi:asparagine synthase-related protein [Mangrovimonas aestuarii]|uniref:asparagine synthase-related protein n=1 Tax=Mangrovimonas aestuarii TaxID=3018443 RepID=UPI00237965C1|nr:asparagine synthase-related protein [Mangrovimonas aestuarii]